MHSKLITIMDNFLAQNGYCRKLLVKDGSCIFRAVSETLFLTQAYHSHVRQMCTDYVWRHQEEFQDCEISEHRELAGITDMMALSRIYQLEFFVFQVPGLSPINVTGSGHATQICLVYADNGHYDLVQSRAFVQDLAICQSVVYEVLYRGVFGLTVELQEAVSFIRQQKKSSLDSNGKIFVFPESLQKLCAKDLHYQGGAIERATPPLPYRIAKALDPVLYRNVELDIVQEEKREIKLRLQGRSLYGVFCPGDKCQVQLEEDNPSGTLYNAHVQEINEPKGPVVVFIEELGEKKTVSYSCLRPLPLSANKQGPVPYGDRRGRCRRKSAMPSAAEFVPPSAPVRSPRSSTVPRSRGADVSQPVHTTITSSQPVSLECGGVMGVGESMEAVGGASYSLMTSSSLPLAQQPSAGQGVGGGSSGGVVYWMPVVSVPYANTMGQVNLAWAPSQDPFGKDLPLTDMNTLRYFFNLGVEYFRISANMQQPQQPQQQPQQSYMTSPMPQVLASYPPTSTVYMPVEQGASFAVPAAPFPPKAKSQGHPHSMTSGRATGPSQGKGGGGAECRVEGMEMGSDVSDNGFTSCGEGGPAGEEDLDVASNRTDDDSGSTQGEEAGSEKGGTKGKGKRKYYMYGSHKLIKPIKEIPPRFQLMLAENSAAKARCEGQPIYMQLSPADLMALEQGEASALNVDAQCFYPAHPYDTIVLDDSGMASFTTACHPPPIVMPPPPPVMQAAGIPTPVSVVYSSLPSSSSATALPPPTFTRPALPVPSLPPHPRAAAAEGKMAGGPAEGKLLPVVVAGGPLGKGPSSSGPEKRPDELAGPSSNKAASSHVSVSSFSLSLPPAFPVSSSMPPPLSAPPLHAGSAHPPLAGGGKQCFYMYSSPSTGFPTLPATPPQGQSHGPALSQGQVVYVMNPQGYGPASPCTGYQPTLMAPPTAHTMGVACPPVAVQ
ncbi:uncharacterized protein LOC143283927 isoform X2 [Babylonia areolata]|uniref:uncharacterized protein LOC143283927 isoform X2 n=1 Tax=Babylonia areolata TaxID=304850 RepID=UPI003FCFAEA5